MVQPERVDDGVARPHTPTAAGKGQRIFTERFVALHILGGLDITCTCSTVHVCFNSHVLGVIQCRGV